ncbi:DUF4238 domain-containing protein [Streptomyces olivaceus]|uniref:DUF4238 domain-containing protein n=1 Tax=Streptomyces olivaceus TaxID=47716 RepID=UPI0022EDC1E8|nr:hypothetical protein TPA0906_11570 [Streptomyces olivaceus]
MGWKVTKRVANPWGQVPVSGGGQAVNPRVHEYMGKVAAAAERRDCLSRRHHYVPKAYLKAWSFDGKRVRVLDTVKGLDRPLGLRDTCVREDFYRVTDPQGAPHNQAEAMLSVIDDESARLLRLLRSWEPGDDLAFDDFMSLAVVLAFQRNRTPQCKRLLEAQDTWMRVRALQELPTLTTSGFVASLFRSAYGAADEHSTRQLELWDDPQARLITSDQPVILSTEASGSPPSTLTSRYLWWPLSPSRMLVLSQDLQPHKVVHRVLPRREVDRLRAAVIRNAEAVVIALPRDTDLPTGRSLRRRPQLSVACTPIDPTAHKCRIELGSAYGAKTIDRVCQPLCALASAEDVLSASTGPT